MKPPQDPFLSKSRSELTKHMEHNLFQMLRFHAARLIGEHSHLKNPFMHLTSGELLSYSRNIPVPAIAFACIAEYNARAPDFGVMHRCANNRRVVQTA